MPAPVDYRLDGWELLIAPLELDGNGPQEMAELRSRVADETRRAFDLPTLAEHPTVAAVRRLFRAAGTDPTRYRPSSEALIRRLLKGDEIPSIHPFVDLNNCLSARLAVPACVMAEGTFEGPFTLRSGRDGESYESLRGPFNLAGRPLLVDQRGPCDTPITGCRRVMVTDETRRSTLVAYLPRQTVPLDEAGAELDRLLDSTPVRRLDTDS